MTSILTPGAMTYRQWGHLHIRIDRDHEGVSIAVTRHATLDRTFLNEDLDAARTYLTYIRDAALAGTPIWQIEAGALALVNAGHAVTHADAELVAAVNSTMDAVKADADAEKAKLAADVADIMGERQGWYAARKQARHAVIPTRTNVHCKPLTEVEQDLIRTHQDGQVTTRPGQPWTVLQAIVRRGYGTAVYGTGRRIVAVQLNARGLDAAQQTEKAA